MNASVPGLPANVCVLSDEVGVIGGAAKATLLLCELLSESGSKVDLFVTATPSPDVAKRISAGKIQVHSAPIPYGSRYQLPSRSNAIAAWLRMSCLRDAVLHAVGMQREVSQFFALPGSFRSFVWETTEALPGNKFVRSEMRRRLSKVDALLVPSKAVEANARGTYAYDGRIGILPFWVEDRGLRITARPTTAPKFLFVGRMDEDKGFHYLIPAFAGTKSKHSSIGLDICGSGDPSRIKTLVNPPQGVVARGSVSDGELDEKLANCFAVVLPSLHEGYPLTLLEACSYGKPVIASAVGSIPEVFAGRECAILVPPKDIAALEAAMIALIEEPAAVYARRAADARQLYEEVSSRDAIVTALIAAYGESGAQGR